MEFEQLSNRLEQVDNKYNNEIEKIYGILNNIITQKDIIISNLQEQIQNLKIELNPKIIIARTDNEVFSFPKSSVEIDITNCDCVIDPKIWIQFPNLKVLRVNNYANIYSVHQPIIFNDLDHLIINKFKFEHIRVSFAKYNLDTVKKITINKIFSDHNINAFLNCFLDKFQVKEIYVHFAIDEDDLNYKRKLSEKKIICKEKGIKFNYTTCK